MCIRDSGTDVRNYGGLDGIPECKKLCADELGVAPENIIVGGASSLNLMYDYISQCYTPVSYTHLDVYKRQLRQRYI